MFRVFNLIDEENKKKLGKKQMRGGEERREGTIKEVKGIRRRGNEGGDEEW